MGQMGRVGSTHLTLGRFGLPNLTCLSSLVQVYMGRPEYDPTRLDQTDPIATRTYTATQWTTACTLNEPYT